MALSGSQVSRLGLYGGPRPPYGAFTAKEEAATPTVTQLTAQIWYSSDPASQVWNADDPDAQVWISNDPTRQTWKDR